MPPKARTEKTSKSDQRLSTDRKVSAISGVTALVFLCSLFYGYNNYLVKYIAIPHLHSLTDRIVFTLRYQLIGLTALVFSITEVGLTRAVTAASNPLAGNESVVEKSNRILTNTVEQFLINAINQLVLSTYLTESNLRLIPLLSIVFIIGRIAFWIGYKIAPKYRGFGFTVTYLPTLVVFGLNLYFFVTTNTNYLLDGAKPFSRV